MHEAESGKPHVLARIIKSNFRMSVAEYSPNIRVAYTDTLTRTCGTEPSDRMKVECMCRTVRSSKPDLVSPLR